MPWNLFSLSQNGSVFQPTPSECEDFIRQVFAARCIWRHWFRAITNPAFALCRSRLRREFQILDA
jgi:hypothetical protein